jgi:transposase
MVCQWCIRPLTAKAVGGRFFLHPLDTELCLQNPGVWGRAPGITPFSTHEFCCRSQKRKLLKFLVAGPRKAGYHNELWTCSRVAAVIAERLHVLYHPCHVWKILRSLGWSSQKPEQQARESDDDAIERWRKRDWLRIKRGLAKR